jgi:hypothetical protein
MEAQMRLALRKEEEEEVKQGRMPLHATSATAFLAAGIQLENTQCVISFPFSLYANLTLSFFVGQTSH